MKAKLQYCSITLLPHGTKQSSPSFLKSYLLGRDTSLILDLMINSLSSKPILYLGLWFVCLNFFALYNRLSRKFHCMVVLTSFLFFVEIVSFKRRFPTFSLHFFFVKIVYLRDDFSLTISFLSPSCWIKLR